MAGGGGRVVSKQHIFGMNIAVLINYFPLSNYMLCQKIVATTDLLLMQCTPYPPRTLVWSVSTSVAVFGRKGSLILGAKVCRSLFWHNLCTIVNVAFLPPCQQARPAIILYTLVCGIKDTPGCIWCTLDHDISTAHAKIEDGVELVV